jgi:hypothetical protein
MLWGRARSDSGHPVGVPFGESELKNVIDLFVETRQVSGGAREAYDYWVRGRALTPHVARWSILHDVLGW